MSDTPMKRYELLCPSCSNETIAIPAGTPEEPFCSEESCENHNQVIDLDTIRSIVAGWSEYITDLDALLDFEKYVDEEMGEEEAPEGDA